MDEKLVFSPYSVGTSQFKVDEVSRINLRSEQRLKLGISKSAITLLFVGKLSYRKGPDLLLKAIKKLPNEIRRQVVTIFVGSGKLKEYLRTLTQRPPQIKVIFVGFQNQTQLSYYYHCSDLLVLPSRKQEPWGLVVNEALHHGLPCVVSEDVGCAPDLISPGITGEIFKTRSIQGLAKAIERALALINYPQVREKCRWKVSGYNVEKAAEGIAQAYRTIKKPTS